MQPNPAFLAVAALLATVSMAPVAANGPAGTAQPSKSPAANTTAVVAHRGLLRHAPENTLANFQACLELRLGFELDVRRAQDGTLVCIHDATLERTTDGRGQVADHTLEQLKTLDAGGWFGPAFAGQRIPTIDEVFALVAGHPARDQVLLAADLKADDEQIEADVVELAVRHKLLDRLLFIGRTIDNPGVRRRLRRANPAAQTATLAAAPEAIAVAVNDSESNWVYLRHIPPAATIGRIHAAGKKTFLAGDTVSGREPQNWRRAASAGIDAVLTNHALALAGQLREARRRRAELAELLAPHYAPPEEFRGDPGPYRSPLEFADGSKVQDAADWQRRRAEILREWHEMLGPWPELLEAPNIRYFETERRGNVTQHRVHVEVYPGEKYTAGHLLVPDGPGPFPAVLVTFYESETSIGQGERGRGTHDYGWQLAQRGFVTLSIGTPGSIEEPDKRTRELLTEAGERQDRQPLSFLAYVAANCHTALARLDKVDGERIGVVGLSYGGKWSMFASCLYDKFACAVWSDPGIVFNEENGNVNYWEPWYLGYEQGRRRPAGIPNEERPRTGLYGRLVAAGRDLNDLHALICPRPVLVAGGTEDPPRNWRALNHLVEINELLGYRNRVAMTSRPTHVPTPAALEKTLGFLEYHLK